ncbi:G-type lectin S-receptor-like serine/threonine-protein kinase CES101 [Jatropha curcas]|uniref:G-type lectin S-receptor-like serine/threonine-protein kinase CES101 n=1 Tax=Jatropha curcas TaxID=180498 RepID=UPI0009D719D2|nr:G-type lectin S-receptor-like serine/threonine-protein kinase CES101 [Jatropha curcas]
MARKGQNLFLLSFSCFILLMGSSYSVTDTLLQGQYLKNGDYLMSASGIFRLGFFETRGKHYVGIWYNVTTEQEISYDPSSKVVWVANRNTPLFDNSGILTIGSDRNLEILCNRGDGDPIALTSVEASGYTIATLLDSGNLILSELYSNGSIKSLLWQSFDYPTHTLLPGMKLGFNLHTAHNWSLTSWIDNWSPAIGSFTFGMDRNETNQLKIWWAGDLYWTSGTWEDGRFSLSHELAYQDQYHFRYVSNENEKYFTYYANDATTSFPMLSINDFILSSGFANPLISCRSSYDYMNTVGCVDQKHPICWKHVSDFEYTRGFVFGDVFKFNESDNLSINDCLEKCLRNCSCVAYAPTNEIDGTGCEIWSKVTVETSVYRKYWQAIYVRKSKKKKLPWWLFILVGGALVMSLLWSLCHLIWRKYKGYVLVPMDMGTTTIPSTWKPVPLLQMWRKYKEKKANTEQERLLHELGIDRKHNSCRNDKSIHELQFFNFQSVALASNNFASTNKLGEGGFGPVYKGKLLGGPEVAIKRLSTSSRQGLEEFKNEVKVIAKLQHNNLVRLVGCCIEKEEQILIYEYMPNKSLDLLLFEPMNRKVLDWRKRFSIIEGIAQGLLYLHKYSRLKIIHRDLKASNILLDKDMNPKISDFGMAKVFDSEESKEKTKRVVGTYGYISPEYAIKGIFSTKSDVFSFGVLLLEIVSSRRNNSFHCSDGPLCLIVYAWELWQQGRVLELVDPIISDKYQNEVLRCIIVGLLCVQENPMDRPTMLEVTSMIYNEANQLPSPNQPGFYNRRNLQAAEIAEQNQECFSLNGVSISEMEAR